MEEVIRLLEEEQDKLSSRATVLELCKQDASEYQRGRIMGQIEMLTHIMRKLAESYDEE
jgi:hypothetical protein